MYMLFQVLLNMTWHVFTGDTGTLGMSLQHTFSNRTFYFQFQHAKVRKKMYDV